MTIIRTKDVIDNIINEEYEESSKEEENKMKTYK